MTTFYVATLARYVLVDAENEAQARELSLAALQRGLGQDISAKIRVVRPATGGEIELSEWHREMAARDAKNEG